MTKVLNGEVDRQAEANETEAQRDHARPEGDGLGLARQLETLVNGGLDGG